MFTMGKCIDKKGYKIPLVIDGAIWTIVSLPIWYMFLVGRPYNRGFFCDDPSIQYPYKPDTISTTVLLITGFAIAKFVIIIVELLNCIDRRCRRICSSGDWIYCLKGYAAFSVGFIIHQLFVELIKNQLGVLRPNFMDVCRPQFNVKQCPDYITDFNCTSTIHDADDIRNSRQSFPSGHATLSMYIAVYFSIYVERRLNIKYSWTLKLLLQTSLVLTSLMCGILRIHDNKHHPADVIAGFLLGTTVAIVIQMSICRKWMVDPFDCQQQNGCCGICACADIKELDINVTSPEIKNGDCNSHVDKLIQNGTVHNKCLTVSIPVSEIDSCPSFDV